METIEYRNVVNKTDWERGPWDHEPDKVQWRDEATGLPCLIVRGPHGALCGYVGVPAGHPWHGQGYDDVRWESGGGEWDDWIQVHGGLTFASGCGHGTNPERGICHVPGDGEPDDVWWLGFDCAHYGDYSGFSYPSSYRAKWPREDGVYRDIEYVRSQCASLAQQATKPKPNLSNTTQ